jgi:large subunit ribosomal protein L1
MKSSKRFQEVAGKVDKNIAYTVDEGVKVLKQSATAKFDETLEISIILGVDPRHADQNVRGVVSLPHGTGKTKKVLVLTTGAKEKEAQDAGADYVGLDEYVD